MVQFKLWEDRWQKSLREELPSNWELVKAQFLVKRQYREVCNGDEVVTVFRDGQVTRRTNRRTDGFTFSEKEIGYHHIEPGDLAVHKMDGGFGAIGISDSAGKVSPVVNLYRSAYFDLRFVAYFLRAAVYSGYIKSLQKGIRERSIEFDHAQFSEFLLPLPDLASQRRIADRLDRETGKIDSLVKELDEYVGLLEKRKTRFLVESTQVLGESPKSELGRHAKIELGKTIQGEQKRPDDVQLNYVRAGNIQSDGRFDGEVKTMWFSPQEATSYSLRRGDVLVVEGGAGFGRSIVLEDDLRDWGFQNHVIRIRPNKGWDSRFIEYVIRAYKESGYIDLLTVGATIPGFSADKARKLKLPNFDLEQQKQIASAISTELAEMKRLVSECTALKELLLKRRQVLITDMVTGKVEV